VLSTLLVLTMVGKTYASCPDPWSRLPALGHGLSRPLPLALAAGAVVSPLALSPTGADYSLRQFSQDELGGSYRPEPVSLVAPYVVMGATAATYATSTLFTSCSVRRGSSAMLQGMFTTVLTVGLGKWITGRQWPNGGRDPYAADRLDHPVDGRDYAPFRRGIDAAFPSGHTAVMFAAAAAFRAVGKGEWFRYVGYVFATGVGVGMWLGDHHWASDILSGALLGEALGGSSGRAFRVDDGEGRTVAWRIAPTPQGSALEFFGSF